MMLVDLTFDSSEENLACDESLLDLAEDESEQEFLRFWESRSYVVVVGSSNRVDTEVRRQDCSRDGVPILRRRSGGGAVLQGPGCLNVSLVLRMTGDYATISGTNAAVLGKACHALQPIVDGPISLLGLSDLAIGDRKFSGNSQRRRLKFLLFHGTILYAFDLSRVGRYLRHPSKEPGYRKGRSHGDFIMNIGAGAEAIRGAFQREWDCRESVHPPVAGRMQRLLQSRYERDEWNFRL